MRRLGTMAGVVALIGVAACQQRDDVGNTAVQSTTIENPPPAKWKDAGWYPPVLNQELDFGATRNATVITATGEELAKLGKRMIAGPQPLSQAVDTINVTVLAGPLERSQRHLLHFSIKADDMRNLARRDASGKQYLDAAYEVGSWTPENDDLVREYCVAKTPFCARLDK